MDSEGRLGLVWTCQDLLGLVMTVVNPLSRPQPPKSGPATVSDHRVDYGHSRTRGLSIILVRLVRPRPTPYQRSESPISYTPELVRLVRTV